MEPLKIVQIITKMDVIGGAQSHVRDLSISLQEKGHDVTVISGENGNIYDELSKYSIRYIQSEKLQRKISIFKDIQSFIEIRKILKEVQPDLVATHSSKAGIIGRLASWSLKIPTVFTAHGWSFTEGVSKKKRMLFKLVERFVARMTDGIINVSYYDHNLATINRIAPKEKLHVIQNGVHDYIGKKTLPKRLQSSIQITMVARFQRPKQQIDAITALAKLQSERCKLVFAGDGPLLSAAKQYAKEQKVDQQIVFLGDHQNIEGLLRQTDIFLLLSDWEGFPLSILEAMRQGLPIIASNVGGVKESVYNGQNGYLVEKNNHDDIIQALKKLIENEELKLQMGKESRKLFEEYFTFEEMLNKTEAYYQKIIAEKESRFVSKGEWTDESAN